MPVGGRAGVGHHPAMPVNTFNYRLFLARLDAAMARQKMSDRALSLAVTDGQNRDLIRDLRRRPAQPKMTVLRAIAAALDCTPDYLVGITDDPTAPPPPISERDRAVLEEIIAAALEYRGALSTEELADAAATAFVQHYVDGMTAKDFDRILRFRIKQAGRVKSH